MKVTSTEVDQRIWHDPHSHSYFAPPNMNRVVGHTIGWAQRASVHLTRDTTWPFWHSLLTYSSFPLRYKLAVITAVPTLLTVRAYSNSINERSSCHFLFLFNLSPSVSVLLAYDTTNFYAILLVCRYKILPKMEFHDLWNLA